MNQDFHIPDNIAKYLKEHDGVVLDVILNSASADYGYAHVMHFAVKLSMLTRTCHRCGYDPLHNPNIDSKCQRHSYNAWRYDTVFLWTPTHSGKSLEEAFSIWIEANNNPYKAIKEMTFGKVGWQ